MIPPQLGFALRIPAVILAILAACAISACGRESGVAPTTPAKATGDLFVDATETSGIRFKHVNGMSGEFYYPEVIGSGVALFDYNNDGKLDVLALQGTM